MRQPKLSKLELEIMDTLWRSTGGPLAIREIQESFPPRARPAYTTVQTTVYRLEKKGAVRRARRISNADLFEAVISREAARGRLLDELLGFFGGKPQAVMAHLVQSGKLTLKDVQEAERLIRARKKETTK